MSWRGSARRKAGLTVFVIFFMLYLHRKSMIETMVLTTTLPFSVVGSIWLLAVLDYNLSLAVAVGMSAGAGLAVDSIVQWHPFDRVPTKLMFEIDERATDPRIAS